MTWHNLPAEIPIFYEDDSVVLINADCRDILPLLPKVDLVLTDPPYGIMFRSKHRKIKHLKIEGDKRLPLDLIEIASGLATRAVYVFCRWDRIELLPKPKSVIAWVKNNWSAGDLKHEHGRQWEVCCFYPKEHHEFIERIPDVIHADRTGNGLHPTEKPVELLGKIIGCNVGDLILDPFAGVCTTGVAAKQLGRRCILIEMEERYAEIGAKRLSQEELFYILE